MTPAGPGALTLVAARASAGEETVPLFSDEGRAGVSLSQERLIELSALLSPLYSRLVDAVGGALDRRFRVGAPAATLLVREALVSPVHAYLDRLLRLDLLLSGRPGAVWRVPRAEPPPRPRDAAELRLQCVNSLAYNQALLGRLAALWGLPVEGAAPAEPAAPAASGPRVNLNFGGASLSVRLRRKALESLDVALRAAGIGRRTPALSMAYHTEPLRNAGFYMLGLEDVRGRLPVASDPADAALRASLVEEPLLSQADAIAGFLGAAGFSDLGRARHAARDLAAFASESYPETLLEALPGNLFRADAVLAPFGRRPLLVAEVNNDEATLLMASSKRSGREVIGFQHGGHSGYVSDHIGATEIEYSYFDRFVSWGWTTMPDFAVCRDVPVTPLPSPWLDERARYWRRALPEAQRDPRGKPFGFLFMSNKVYRFPPAPSGAFVARVDRLPEIAAMFRGLVDAAASRGVSVLHKPYNEESNRLLRGVLDALSREHAGRYERLSAREKGLAPEHLRRCAMVLWDQPGTGFLECLASGIPTLALWPRIYNQEERRYRALFAEMEQAGLIHRRAETLVEELERFKSAPDAWRNERKALVARFLRELGWSDPDWPALWRRFLDERAAAAQ